MSDISYLHLTRIVLENKNFDYILTEYTIHENSLKTCESFTFHYHLNDRKNYFGNYLIFSFIVLIRKYIIIVAYS